MMTGRCATDGEEMRISGLNFTGGRANVGARLFWRDGARDAVRPVANSGQPARNPCSSVRPSSKIRDDERIVDVTASLLNRHNKSVRILFYGRNECRSFVSG